MVLYATVPVNGTDAPLVSKTLPLIWAPEASAGANTAVLAHAPPVLVPAVIVVAAVVPALVCPPPVMLQVPVRAVFALPEFVNCRLHVTMAATCVHETTLAWT